MQPLRAGTCVEGGINMRRWMEFLVLSALVAAATGCRCAPGFNCYADFMDDVGDTEVLFDSWYFPRLDISRAGRPDWCGPINRRLAPCRCNTGTYKQYDDCWRYPPGYPTWYPGQSVLPPEASVVTPVPGSASPAIPGMVPVPGAQPPGTPSTPPPPPEAYEEGGKGLPGAPPPVLPPKTSAAPAPAADTLPTPAGLGAPPVAAPAL